MPYIKQERRERLDVSIEALIREIQASDEPDGEVNYVISRIAVGALLNASVPRYKDVARVIGAFQSACYEFYRRTASKIEEIAIQRNGDIKEYV